MLKKEVVWREILHQAIANKKYKTTQKEIAQKYNFSLSTVFNALKNIRQTGAIEAGAKGIRLINLKKMLYFWATFRKLEKDVIYKTNVPKNVKQIEGEMPPEAIFGAFSAFNKKFKNPPADYDKAYVYIKEKELNKIKERFPFKKGYGNLVVLKADSWLKSFGQITPDCQIFVDLWNLPEWYVADYLEDLKKKIIK